jgi:hypothetical protein
MHKSHDSSVGLALGYGLDDRCSRVRLPVGAGNFSLHHGAKLKHRDNFSSLTEEFNFD